MAIERFAALVKACYTWIRTHHKEITKPLLNEAIIKSSKTATREASDVEITANITKAAIENKKRGRRSIKAVSNKTIRLAKNSVETNKKGCGRPKSDPIERRCRRCDKEFRFRSGAIRHERIHSGEKPFACLSCGKRFSQKDSVDQHHLVHTGQKPYQCGHCSKRFARSGCLSNHKRVHTGERPHPCDKCQMNFTQKGILARHKLVHTKETPYKCCYCDRGFARLSGVDSHQRQHNGNKPCACRKCGATFAWSSQMIRHINKRHNTI